MAPWCGATSWEPPNGNHRLDISAQHFFLPCYTTITMKGPFPEIEGGGSLILAWQIRNKRVLVVGGGEVSAAA
jgi:hypothetical protein